MIGWYRDYQNINFSSVHQPLYIVLLFVLFVSSRNHPPLKGRRIYIYTMRISSSFWSAAAVVVLFTGTSSYPVFLNEEEDA